MIDCLSLGFSLLLLFWKMLISYEQDKNRRVLVVGFLFGFFIFIVGWFGRGVSCLDELCPEGIFNY